MRSSSLSNFAAVAANIISEISVSDLHRSFINSVWNPNQVLKFPLESVATVTLEFSCPVTVVFVLLLTF
ncbi:hypothetical protein ACHQM5_016580 [Ranunculus cassubicifolius]